MMMNGGAAGFVPSSSDGGAWEQQEYDAPSSSTVHNTNHNNWGSAAAVSSSSATQQGGGGGGMSAEDTRRLMESLASQLEPNPLRSGGSGSSAHTSTTDGTFCVAASSSMPLTAYDDQNRSDTAATASHLPQQQYHMARPHPFSNHSQQQQQQPLSVSMQYQLKQQQQASSSSTYPSEYGDYSATSPTSAVSASMSDMMTMSAASMAQPQQGLGLQAAPRTTKDNNNQSGNCNHDNDNDNGRPDQNNVVAAFTEQDEKDELATLTIQEILDAEQDVRGQLADAMGGLSVTTTTTAGGASGAGASTRTTTAAMGKAAVTSSSSCSSSDPFRQSSTASTAAAANANASTPPHPHPQLSIEETSALLLLRAELLRIPPHQKRSYTDAVQRCPDQTDQQVQLAYLRRDGYDAHVAAGRIVQYWENRLAVFGEDRCYLPMTLDGAAREEVGDMRSESLTYSTAVLPARDANGRAVVYVKANRMGRTDALGMEKMVSIVACTT